MGVEAGLDKDPHDDMLKLVRYSRLDAEALVSDGKADQRSLSCQLDALTPVALAFSCSPSASDVSGNRSS